MLLDVQGSAAAAVTPKKNDFSAIETINLPNERFASTLSYLQDRLQSIGGIIACPAASESKPDPPKADEGSPDEDVDQQEDPSSSLTTELTTPSKRSKTSFAFAHPPPAPKARTLLKVRPRVLLQLHQLSEDRRSKPVIDVLPSMKFAPKLAKRFPRVSGSLGVDDLLLVKSQLYEVDDGDNSDDLDGREVVAAICQPKRTETELQGQTEICMSRGAPWLASSKSNGGYEFACLGDDGLTTRARWIPRRRSGENTKNPASKDKTFHFSILTPNTRRHPIIATMDRRSISVSDQYTIPDIVPSSPTSTATESSGQSYFERSEPTTKALIDMDEDLRMLIMVTGVWVSFVEGWSENFKYHDNIKRALTLKGSPTTPQGFASARSRRDTLDVLQRSPINEEPFTPPSHRHTKSDGPLPTTPSHGRLRSSLSLNRTKTPLNLTLEQRTFSPRPQSEYPSTPTRRSRSTSRRSSAPIEISNTPNDGATYVNPSLVPNVSPPLVPPVDGVLPEDFEDSPTDCESVTKAPETTPKLAKPPKKKFRPLKGLRNLFRRNGKFACGTM